MSKEISRRTFLKGGIASACTLAISGTPAAAEKKPDIQLLTLIDISKCIGCEACVDACREVNAEKFPDPKKPFPKMFPKRVPVADWSDKQNISDRLTPYNWLFIQNASVEIDGEEIDLTIPRRCMHCVNPPCVKLCPFGSARQLENGISIIKSDICLGGSKCKAVCPWHIPERQTGVGIYLDILPSLAGNGVMYKCDRCYNKIAKGELPACIEECPENVQTIGPRDEIIKQAQNLAKETKGYIYGEKENGGTNTIYISPVPFDKLNNAIEKGNGKPHLKPVKDTMENANNLAAAMFIAPFAGVAAAAGKYYQIVKTGEKNDEGGPSNESE
ncbi:MAG: 4Fe-4S dicluster domain-containing protein [Desulfobacteraceae bacterium]|nr:4Fe-4S dicluster domain-containing protein [Desulfobacteraceae bacterium]